MRPRLLLASIAVAIGITAAVMASALPAEASPVAHVLAKPPSSLKQVIDNISTVLTGLLAALATLFLTVGGVRYLLAGGDPSEVHKAKDALKYAAIGYAVAALAKPVLLPILQKIVGV